MIESKYPKLFLTTLVVALLTIIWGSVRLFMFRESVVPLTFVLPLLVCIWTRRRWQLWGMASTFIVMAAIKVFWILPDDKLTNTESLTYFLATCFNVILGGVVVQAIMAFRDRLEARNETISAQNSELEAQAEELSQQNEEIKSQSEELAQQNEEIESQAEELERQNEELHEANDRLASREHMLQAILESGRAAGDGREALDEVCRRALAIIGQPATGLAVLELAGDVLHISAQATADQHPPLPSPSWPVQGSLSKVAMDQNQTAYVDDLLQRPDLAAPFAANGAVRSILATPLRAEGNVCGTVVICSDHVTHWTHEQFSVVEWIAAQCGLIIEGLRWQAALKDRAQQMQNAIRAKDQFLAMLSHELRTPLTPVLAAAGALENDHRLPPDARDDLGMIRRNVAVQSRLIDDLLDLTRIGRGKLDLHQQVLNIESILRDTAAIVSADLDARGQSLSINLTIPENCAVVGDAARLQQVFWNLLKNAIKFSPVKGHISVVARVDCDVDPPHVAIDVIDVGVGIAGDDLQRIFLPFEQATASLHRGGGMGLGLGLSIAKAIIELHEGTIVASSDGVGRGARFSVTLPMSAVPQPANSPAPAASVETQIDAPASSSQSLRILLVEDHVDTGRLIARLLRNSGHTVEHSEDVASAVRVFEENPFDLLISDLGLPDGSGIDLMRQIRSITPEMPAICLSGYGMDSDVDATREAGFHEHLTKPVDLQQLHNAIGRIALGKSNTFGS